MNVEVLIPQPTIFNFTMTTYGWLRKTNYVFIWSFIVKYLSSTAGYECEICQNSAMNDKKDKYPSTFTIDNFSSTATLTNNDHSKIPVGSTEKTNVTKEYNPYEHRILEHPNTFSGALIHLLKSSLGTGILAIPRAFKNAGLVTGIIGTIFIGFLWSHPKKCVKKYKIPSLGYAETAQEIFKSGPRRFSDWSNAAKNFVEIALVLTYYVGNAVYVVFITESITKLLSFYFEDAESWYPYIILTTMVLLIICCQIRELKHLVPFSFIANTTMYYIILHVLRNQGGEIFREKINKFRIGNTVFLWYSRLRHGGNRNHYASRKFYA
ncbi:hypothetical protein NQ317_019114 [Molorchus minor]|uniref:Amino acid transporter transmembrane domain-containing protein n=1 Tax=Molorchus minor TaxID=1323400 RepID=A0ABQ9J1K8_9CUCU|nr:hypothetical protein NQ317_019114 [Molorchus minor]